MPTYEFYNKVTEEQWEEMMSISAREQFLKDNPDVVQVITAPAFISGISGVTHKNDSGFGDMMSRIAQANPHSPLAEKYGSKGVKETKVRNVVKKHKAK